MGGDPPAGFVGVEERVPVDGPWVSVVRSGTLMVSGEACRLLERDGPVRAVRLWFSPDAGVIGIGRAEVGEPAAVPLHRIPLGPPRPMRHERSKRRPRPADPDVRARRVSAGPFLSHFGLRPEVTRRYPAALHHDGFLLVDLGGVSVVSGRVGGGS